MISPTPFTRTRPGSKVPATWLSERYALQTYAHHVHDGRPRSTDEKTGAPSPAIGSPADLPSRRNDYSETGLPTEHYTNYE